MLRRLIFGLVLGLMVGAGLAAGLIRLGEGSFAAGSGVMFAYLAAALAGAVTGLIAGKPIWASNAKIEGGLKALFGALMGAGAMFALRQWATGFDVNLSFLGGGGPAPVGELPAASLPLIAAVLGGLFGLDNTDEGEGSGEATRKRIAGGPRVGASAAEKSGAEVVDDEGADVAPRRAKR
jgi:hypothetical protein